MSRAWRLVGFRTILSLMTLLLFAGGSCGGGGEKPCLPTDPGCGGSTPTFPASRTLSVPFIAQRTPVWCWAATSTMVLNYYGNLADQCQIVSYILQRNCCLFGVGDSFCATTASLQAMQAAMAFGGVRSTYVPSPLTFEQIVTEIGSGRPIILSYRGSFSGHVVTLVGYNRTNQTVVIYDPYYGIFTVPYGATFSYNGQLIWSETLANLSR